jgi:gamma-glutamylputrescine oxidase
MRHSSYWESELPPRPVAGDLPGKVDVLIVGAGFMGRWLARFMSPSRRVLVVERDGFSYGASTRNAGFLTCGQVSEMLQDARHAGTDAVIETFLQRREGIAIVRREFPGIDTPCGSFDYDDLTTEKRELAKLLNEAAGEQVYSTRHCNFGGAAREAMFNAADGAVHPVRLLNMLRESATDAQFEFGVTARQVGGGKAVLETPGGTLEVAYGRAFICVNGFAVDLDPSTEVVPGRGQVIVTSALETETANALGYLNAGYDYFRFVDGRLLVGGGRDRFTAERGTRELEPTREVRDYLAGVAARIAGHEDFTVDYHWAGIMGFVGGEHLGGSPRRALDDRTEVVAGFGGMGVALTPLHAKRLAEE